MTTTAPRRPPRLPGARPPVSSAARRHRSGAATARTAPVCRPHHYRWVINYYTYRYLDSMTGRWLSRDPIGERGGRNLYGFVFNKPITWFDDLGAMPRPGGVGTPDLPSIPSAPGGITTTPKPPESPASAFHHYGNWGGPGWASGGWRPEDGPLPKPGEPGYNAPVDARDICYQEHDYGINDCPKCPKDKYRKCIQGCDHKLADCLRRAEVRGPEPWAFDTLIPNYIH